MRTIGWQRARMFCLWGTCTLALGLILIFSSCTKLPSAEKPTVTLEKLTDFSSLPTEWGELISVSSRADVGHIFHLWLQDKDGTIRMVKFNDNTNQLLPRVVLISRK